MKVAASRVKKGTISAPRSRKRVYFGKYPLDFMCTN